MIIFAQCDIRVYACTENKIREVLIQLLPKIKRICITMHRVRGKVNRRKR